MTDLWSLFSKVSFQTAQARDATPLSAREPRAAPVTRTPYADPNLAAADAFEAYYQRQSLVATRGEWLQLIRQYLPARQARRALAPRPLRKRSAAARGQVLLAWARR